jgi:hypothetical protein
MLTEATLTPFRRALLAEIPPDDRHLAAAPSIAFVWPTETCSIGCAHCNFSSRPRRKGAPSDVSLAPAQLVAWLVAAEARGVTLCGGGEPLDEPAFCDEVVALAGRTALDFAIYTSGVSLCAPIAADDQVARWRRLRGDDHAGRFWVRLSLDRFHAERVGVVPVCDWITAIDRHAPEWKVSLRALRVVGDDTLDLVAAGVGGQIEERGSSARLRLPSGRSLVVERMSFIFDGRGAPELLARRGLSLPEDDRRALAPWQALVGRTRRIGRPLSRPLTVGVRHVDLEVHADQSVHVLESQPADARLKLGDHGWADIRDSYYRDPLIHLVATGGLPYAARFLRQAIEGGVAPRSTVPFSIEQLADRAVLDWMTAAAVVELQSDFGYPERAVALARERLKDSARHVESV